MQENIDERFSTSVYLGAVEMVALRIDIRAKRNDFCDARIFDKIWWPYLRMMHTQRDDILMDGCLTEEELDLS